MDVNLYCRLNDINNNLTRTGKVMNYNYKELTEFAKMADGNYLMINAERVFDPVCKKSIPPTHGIELVKNSLFIHGLLYNTATSLKTFFFCIYLIVLRNFSLSLSNS